MPTRVEIDPDQLAAVHSEVQGMLAALRGSAERRAESETDEYGRAEAYTVGMRSGVELAEEMIRHTVDRITRHGCVILDD